MCRRTEEKVGRTVGLPCHRHFIEFFNVPVQSPTRATLLTITPRNRTISVVFYDAYGYRRTYSHLKPRVSVLPFVLFNYICYP